MKKDQLAYGNIDKTDGIPDASRDKIEPKSSLINEEVDPPNDESVEKLLRSCQEHRNIFQRRFEAVIKLTAEVVKQNEDNVNCIPQLLEFTIELQQEEIKLFRLKSIWCVLRANFWTSGTWIKLKNYTNGKRKMKCKSRKLKSCCQGYSIKGKRRESQIIKEGW